MKTPGIKLLARAGFYLEYCNYSYDDKFNFGGVYPNLEVGLGWSF